MIVEIDKKAQKAYLALDALTRERIKKALLELKNFPNVSNTKKLSAYDPAYRKRVGEYRILFDVLEETLTVYDIRHRQSGY